MTTIKQECPQCGGTGVYSGFAEPAGVAVICYACDGRGWNIHSYKEFTKRKVKRGIHTVYTSRGRNIITGVGPVPATAVPYKQFLKEHKVE